MHKKKSKTRMFSSFCSITKKTASGQAQRDNIGLVERVKIIGLNY